ncbi:hypothetical protein NA57DRAFT_72667 [Rhizodiscina lignyota]|uniref:Adhesin domain-containing protein n=1 Tax=Rhizodiscina lignyota TaxID=1504668 RepID=A0A9P4IGM2_9PEZI|nr:hypothetical protein NA57DRAFT_72667 [Rhizodiscina lignyota]
MTQYSDNHSDGDDEFETHSFSDEYSPTDGFNQREHPQDFFVQTPTSSSKDEEAAAESRSPTGASSSQNVVHEYRVPSSPRRQDPDERTPLLYEAPPPAYSAPHSLYQPVSPILDHNDTRPFSHALFPDRDPQSMGGPGDPSQNFDTERNQYSRPKSSIMSQLFTGIGRIVWVFIGIVILLSILGEVFVGTGGSTKSRLPDSGSSPDQKNPTSPNPESPNPEKDTRPNMPALPNLPSWCDAKSSKSEHFDFENPPSFLFSEEIDKQIFRDEFDDEIQLFGGVRVVEAPSSQKSHIRVDTTLSSSDPYSIKSLHFEKTSDKLILQIPSFDRKGHGSSRQPCMAVDAVIYIKKTGNSDNLSNLSVKTKQMGIAVGSRVELALDKLTLGTGAGRVASEAKLLNSRETIINVGAGSVSGHYNLLDLLSITTSAGSINADVMPKEATKGDEKPARLECTSRTGPIDVDMPPRDDDSMIPDRDYQTTIKTTVGSIYGRYIHGLKTEIETRAGSQSVNILPYSTDDYASTLKTHSMSGMSQINVQTPYKGGVIKRMTSSHITQTGSLHLSYPQEWEGNVSGSTTTGSLTLRGKDIVIEQYDDGFINKKVKGHKGEGHLQGKLDFQTRTGSAGVTVGKTFGNAVRREVCDSFKDIGI